MTQADASSRRAQVRALPTDLQRDLDMLVAVAVWHGQITHDRGAEILGHPTPGPVRQLVGTWRLHLPLLDPREETQALTRLHTLALTAHRAPSDEQPTAQRRLMTAALALRPTRGAPMTLTAWSRLTATQREEAQQIAASLATDVQSAAHVVLVAHDRVDATDVERYCAGVAYQQAGLKVPTPGQIVVTAPLVVSQASGAVKKPRKRGGRSRRERKAQNARGTR